MQNNFRNFQQNLECEIPTKYGEPMVIVCSLVEINII